MAAMVELNERIARLELRCEQLIIHVRRNRYAPEAELERLHLFALLEDLVALKTERQWREDLIDLPQAA